MYTAEEVAEHVAPDDCWTVYRGKVYDVTEYAKVHPGGRKIFLGKGKDCTALYDQYHPWVNCDYLIGKYQVGVLK
jgi:cytochrome b involved in lipid metabolism